MKKGYRNISSVIILIAIFVCLQFAFTQPHIIELPSEYYFGDGLGDQATLVLNPDSSFALNRSYDVVGFPDTKNRGVFSIVRGHLILFPNWLNIVSYAGGIHTHYISIKWGERYYLIPDESMIDFCNEINLGREPRKDANGTFFLRRDDWDKPVTDFPQLPFNWKIFLLPKPIAGKIIGITELGEGKVNLGKKDSLIVHMTLVVQCDNTDDAQMMNYIVPVTSVYDDYCIIRSERPNKFWVGAKVTSRFYP